jgi:hypothetical protein
MRRKRTIRELVNNPSDGQMGRVTFGLVQADASWKAAADGYLEVRFEIRRLTLEQQVRLWHYSQRSMVIPIQLPIDIDAVDGEVIGFERDAQHVVFHVCRSEVSV